LLPPAASGRYPLTGKIVSLDIAHRRRHDRALLVPGSNEYFSLLHKRFGVSYREIPVLGCM
jgi:hypothetical protein